MTESDWLSSDDPARMLRLVTENPDHANINCVSDRKLRLFAAACVRREWGLLDETCRHAVITAERFADGQGMQGGVYDASEAVHRLISQALERPQEDSRTRIRLALARACYWVAPQTHRPTVRDCAAAVLRSLYDAFPEAMARFAHDLRDVAGNSFRPVTLPPGALCQACDGKGEVRYCDAAGDMDDEPCRACGGSYAGGYYNRGTGHQTPPLLTPTVLSLAQAAYDDRFADGTLDPARLAVLSDALEEAGCDDWWLLSHLRGEEMCPACLPGPGRKSCAHCHEGNMPLRGPHVRGCWAVDLMLGKE